jgi:hypothetical protein
MNDQVMKAEKELQDFLEENPHLKKDQEKITELLLKTNSDQRLEVLNILISSKLLELQKQLSNLLDLHLKLII